MQNFFLIMVNILLGICACGILTVGLDWFLFFKQKKVKHIILHLTGLIFFGTLFGVGFWTQRTIELGFSLNESLNEFEQLNQKCLQYKQDDNVLEFKIVKLELAPVNNLQTWEEISNFLKDQMQHSLEIQIINLANQQPETLKINHKTLQIIKKSKTISCPRSI